MKTPIAIASLLLLASLAAHAQDFPVSREGGEFDKHIRFVGPELHPAVDASTTKSDVHVAFGLDPKGQSSYWIVGMSVIYTGGQWRFYEDASLPGGDRLPGKTLSRQLGSCAGLGRCVYQESAYVRLTPEQAAQAARDGLRMRWNAQRSGSFEMTIPAGYFAAIIDAAQKP